MRSVKARGFTLAEVVMVIAITGIIAAMAAVFIRKPIEGFVDATRRAAMADAADTALRRISRELHEALPNSVRVDSSTALEFLHVRSGGRYREELPGNILDFTANDTSFDVLGPGVTVQTNDWIVVYNLGITGASAYEGTSSSRRQASAFGTNLSSISITSTVPYTNASPGRRFQVVDMPISYVCSGSQLRRYAGYTITSGQANPPSSGIPAVGGNTLLVDGIAAGGCSFSYASTVSQRDGLVTMNLRLASGSETVNLVYQVHVNNAP